MDYSSSQLTIVAVSALSSASLVLGLVRGVKNRSVVHPIISLLVPFYGMLYFFSGRRLAMKSASQ